MTRTIGIAPSIAEMEAMAQRALDRIPPAFAEHLGAVVMQVQDFAEDDLLAEMDIESPFDLTGVYEGVPLTERSIEHSGTMPDRVRLFRMPILLEWSERGDETLEHLVAHVLVHEIGHHFGLSDEDMHTLEEQVR
ncbi:metallopeptidase family protein [Aurantiacibacter gangjinensis]|uniref:Neutral zinc metallopeptidase n=1 Tax=Aurantiacibacter gangjinensis TaxID=502682 RepID=A0A0G9MRM3_9SPHN|nr:metallopeptidase family protein [Aurantiacibacter gangjinensis]APE28047.1 Acetylglutamate kinase [Aurantiacibacter gangjinensis]KLE31973.1 neutral zinc metallopeptidase [Aurantiacibacter gangjinensis]